MLDSTAFSALLFLLGSLVFLSAEYFYLATPYGEGLKSDHPTLADCLYFSAVTLSSLGYGDFLPQGYGRVVSAATVLSGIAVISLLIGKVASERQSVLLLLLYNSDQQRRLREDAREFDLMTDTMRSACMKASFEELHTICSGCRTKLGAMTNYLAFHFGQGRLHEFGNTSSLRNLGRSLAELAGQNYAASKIADLPPPTRQLLIVANARLAGLADLMLNYLAQDNQASRTLRQLKRTTEDFDRLLDKVQRGGGHLVNATKLTDALIAKADAILPPGNWAKDLNKTLAKDLRISNKLATKCLKRVAELRKAPSKLSFRSLRHLCVSRGNQSRAGSIRIAERIKRRRKERR